MHEQFTDVACGIQLQWKWNAKFLLATDVLKFQFEKGACWISSDGQSTRGGPLFWGIGIGLTPFHLKTLCVTTLLNFNSLPTSILTTKSPCFEGSIASWRSWFGCVMFWGSLWCHLLQVNCAIWFCPPQENEQNYYNVIHWILISENVNNSKLVCNGEQEGASEDAIMTVWMFYSAIWNLK